MLGIGKDDDAVCVTIHMLQAGTGGQDERSGARDKADGDLADVGGPLADLGKRRGPEVPHAQLFRLSQPCLNTTTSSPVHDACEQLAFVDAIILMCVIERAGHRCKFVTHDASPACEDLFCFST